MFASKNSQELIPALIMFSVLVCPLPVYSQQTSESSPDEPEDQQATESRHIERLGDTGSQEWEMDLAMLAAAPVVNTSDGTLPDEAQNQQLQQLLSKLATQPANSRVLSQLNSLLADVLNQANSLMNSGSTGQATELLDVIQGIDPNLNGLRGARQRIESIDEAQNLLDSGNVALESGRVLEPFEDNALYYYQQAQSKDPGNISVQLGLASVQEALIQRALESAHELDFDTAEEWLQWASRAREDQTMVENAHEQVASFRLQHAGELELAALDAMDSGNFNLAEFNIIDLIALGGHEQLVASLQKRLEDARVHGGLEPGQIIRDEFLRSSERAPEIIVIPAGSFLMGTTDASKGTFDNELPRHRVTIRRGFGFGVREVSVAEFRLFIDSSGYRTAAEIAGSSSIYHEAAGRLTKRKNIDWEYDYQGKRARPDMPVIHVNWHDASMYTQWLSTETGKDYRLPSEAEYEFLARAGSNSAFWWGAGSPANVVENLTGARDISPSKRSWTSSFNKYGDGHWGPAPVGSFVANPMGIFDITGNVSEWMEDCWHQNYMLAPKDGSAWVNPGCQRRVVRGGYWASSPQQSRAAFRISAKPETFGSIVGIRIARDL